MALLRLICIILLSINTSLCFALSDDIVTIKNTSSSGKTLYLNRGKFDQIGGDDYGVLIAKENLAEDKTVYKPVAKIKLVKLYDNQSVWVVYKLYIPQAVQKDAKYILLAETALLAGRTDLKIKRTSIVTNAEPITEVKDFLLEGDSLAKRQRAYRVIDNPHKKEKHYDKDIDLIDIDKWENLYGDDRLFVSGIYRSPHAAEFSRRLRVQTFEKMVVAYLNKFNDPDFDYREFYGDQVSAAKELTTKNVKSKFSEKKVLSETQKDKLFEQIKKKGNRWSENYTDEQLQDILEEYSSYHQQKRRDLLKSHLYENQFIFSFGLNLINNENINDAETTEQSRYDFDVALEGYYLRKYLQIETVTVELSARRALDAFFGGDLNVRSTEYSLAAHLNWYPFYLPNTIERNIFYVGLLARFGLASLSNKTADEVGTYQLYSFPGLRGGIKYNFANGYGVRLVASYENIRVDRIKKSNDDGVLPDRTSYFDGKISVGLTKFF
ncbi:MAG: hypothetical protein CME66_03355 [Halobacteriovoraceae bacterium]|jgi:ribonuclease HII|nr:hypothetical protein [Halobacteriovoraceae bacterium]